MSRNYAQQPGFSLVETIREMIRQQGDAKKTGQLPTSITVGTVTLVAGAAKITGDHARAAHKDSVLFLFKQTPGTAGVPYISDWQKGASFTITSTSAGDTSVIAYLIVAL